MSKWVLTCGITIARLRTPKDKPEARKKLRLVKV